VIDLVKMEIEIRQMERQGVFLKRFLYTTWTLSALAIAGYVIYALVKR
jgi:hypothetical protein